ncbi:MAG: dihydroorotate dehydrogenase, partial [Thaumarchaeota archaeon]|nr:dihydroorotate dehydrogenase [Nitrososphaerota archaeon]
GAFSEINNGISKYMGKKGFSKIKEMVGIAKKF